MPNRREFLLQATAASLGVADDRTAKSIEALPGGRGTAGISKRVIANTDLVVSPLAYGLAMSDVSWRSSDIISKTAANIRTAFENGINFFDAADTYGGDGSSEVALGEFLKHSPAVRDEVVIQTKCGMLVPQGWSPGDPINGATFGRDLSREHILRSVEGSLRRIATDRLDVLLLHVPHPLVEPEEVADAFDDLRASGKVRFFGVSNHNALQIELLKRHVRYPLVTNQIRLSLAYYAPIAEQTSFGSLVDYCRVRDIQVQAFSPLRGAHMTGRPSLLSPAPDADIATRKAAGMLEDIARSYGVSAAAIMLAWLMKHPAKIVPIIGASKPEHIVDNCRASRMTISDSEWMELLNVALPIQPSR